MTRIALLFCLVVTFGCNQQVKTIYKTTTQSSANTVAYTAAGGGPETLVFIHAGGLDQQMWADQLRYFGKQYRVLAYDMRGHGKTETVDDRALEIDDLRLVLSEEKVNRVHLIGCSLGAIVAFDFALAYPELVEKLVLVSPGLAGLQETNTEFLEQMMEYVETIQAGDQNAIVDQLLQLNAIGKGNRELAADIESYARTQLTDFVRRGSYRWVPQIKEPNPYEVLRMGKADLPTLVLHGTLDFEYIKMNALAFEEYLPNCERQEIPESGHLINLEAPKVFNRSLRDFLKKP